MDIKIVIGDYEYSEATIENFSIDKSAKNISHTFNATIGIPPFTSYKDYKEKISLKNQQDIKFYLNNELFMFGVVETIIINMESPKIEISGRSKMVCVVNSQAIVKEYTQRNLVKLITQVFQDNIVKDVSVVNAIGENLKSVPAGRILMKESDTIFNFIDRYAILCRCVAISDNEGNLLLTREGSEKNAVQGFSLEMMLSGQGVSNAQGISYVNDFTNRTRFIELTSAGKTSRFLDNTASAGEKTKTTRIIEDEQVRFYTRERSQYNIGGDGEVLNVNNEWLLRRKRAESESLTVKLTGSNAEDFLNKKPELLQLIKVTNQYAMIENVFMVIAEISTTFSGEGFEVKLLLVPQGSYNFATDAKTFLKSLKSQKKEISQVDAPKLILKVEPKIKALYYDILDPLLKTQQTGNFSAGNFEAIERVAFKRNIANKKYAPSK